MHGEGIVTRYWGVQFLVARSAFYRILMKTIADNFDCFQFCSYFDMQASWLMVR